MEVCFPEHRPGSAMSGCGRQPDLAGSAYFATGRPSPKAGAAAERAACESVHSSHPRLLFLG